MIRITAVARGEVQGVGYRYFVTGCARAALDAFVRMVKAEGDGVIRVDALTVALGEASGEFAGFGVKW